MNKDVNGDEYTFRTPEDWGTIIGVLILPSTGKSKYANVDLESGELKISVDEDERHDGL